MKRALLLLLLSVLPCKATLYVNGFLVQGNISTNFPVHVFSNGVYLGDAYSVNARTNLIGSLSNGLFTLDAPLVSLTGSVCAVTSLYNFAAGSSSNFVSITNQTMAGCTQVFYWAYCLTNGSGAVGGGTSPYTTIDNNTVLHTNNNTGSSSVNTNSAVLGGLNNTLWTGGVDNVIAGGNGNQIQSYGASVYESRGCGIGGGAGNVISASLLSYTAGGGTSYQYSVNGFIGGGQANQIGGVTKPYSAVIVGGKKNYIRQGDNTFIGGGQYNTNFTGSTVGDISSSHVIVGGVRNEIYTVGYSCFIGGGMDNQIDDSNGYGIVIPGGCENRAGGGSANNKSYSAVGGGYRNSATGHASVVSGGTANGARGNYSTVPGGESNQAHGAWSYAHGRYAVAVNDGAWVWADTNNLPFTSTAINQFLIRASGGMLVTPTNCTVPTLTNTLTVYGGFYADVGRFGGTSLWVGVTHLGESELKGLYNARIVTLVCAVGFGLLLLNFVRDRKRELQDVRRDEQQAKQIRALEEQLAELKGKL